MLWGLTLWYRQVLINPARDVTIAAVMVSNKWELHQIDLMTGKSTKLGDLSMGNIIGLAIPTSPVAYAINETNNLLILNFLNIGTPISKAITGLQMGEIIVGIDMRPVTG